METYFKSCKGIKKYIVQNYNFSKQSIDVISQRNSTYLYIAEKDILYKFQLGWKPTYIRENDIDERIKQFLSADFSPVS